MSENEILNVDELNFEEEEKGFSILEAISEAKRCLNCKNPKCVEGCPVDNEIPSFIKELSRGNMGMAREIIAEKSDLPAVCGRVCPHETQCEGNCVLGNKGNAIKIGALERFIADFDSDMALIQDKLIAKTRGKVAVIGSGPAGLTVAGNLAKIGFNVVVYEAEAWPGGILLYGIPSFRLSQDVVKREIERISSLGVSFITNTVVGQNITVDEIFAQGFDAVFIGTGTALSRDLNLPGYKYKGIIQSIYFLRMVTLYNQGSIKRSEVPINEGDEVLIIGAGNVAMDAARSAIRMGAKKVVVTYRKTIETMSALKSEYEDALKEGVQFEWEIEPIEYIGEQKKLTGLRAKTPEGEKIIPVDKILIAIGSRPAARIVSTTKGIEVNDNGYVITGDRPYGMTTLKGVFAGGDVVHQPATVVLAMKEAKKVAEGIAAYVDAKHLLGL